MTALARAVAIVAGVLLILLAAVALAREIVLAAGGTFAWPAADRWQRLIAEPTWSTTGLAALVLVVVGAALLVLAVRHVSVVREGPALVTLDTDRGATSVDVPALERALRRRLETTVPGMRVTAIELGEYGEGCRVRIDADVPASDLTGIQARVADVTTTDLEKLAGLKVEAVDVVATRLLLSRQE